MKKRILIISGGISKERVISLDTGKQVAKELKKEIGENSKHTKDLDLLISQTKRCSDILKKISQKRLS